MGLLSLFAVLFFTYPLLSRLSAATISEQLVISDSDALLGVKGDPAHGALEGTGALSSWARTTKSQFFLELTENRADEWVVVMGNEAGDTDSLAAAIAWAYHISHAKENPQKAIALLQTVEDALDLRPENQLALDHSQMAPRHRDLLTIDELPIKPFELSRHLRGIVLVDHNVPTPGWRHASILSIIDHHVDRHMNLSAMPRLLQTSASCSSLVAKLILDSEEVGEHQVPAGERSGIPPDLTDLLLRAIALDSDGLKKKHSYKVDQQSALGLFRSSQWYNLSNTEDLKVVEKLALKRLMIDFSEEMASARDRLGALDLRDLFRRDWKSNALRTVEPQFPVLTTGFASIPYSIETQIHRTPEKTVPEWFAIERAFTSEIGADVSVVLTKYTSETTGKRERQIVVVVAHGWAKRLNSAAATHLFDTICGAIENGLDGLETWNRSDGKPLLPRRKAWRIGEKGPHVGRKVVMPLVQDAVANWRLPV